MISGRVPGKNQTLVLLLLLLLACLSWGCGRRADESTQPAGDEKDVSIDGSNEAMRPAETNEDIQRDDSDEAVQGYESVPSDGAKEFSQEADQLLEEQEEETERPKVKGIFVTGAMAGTSNMENLIDLVDKTELNAIVIDVKNDEGRVTYSMDAPMVQELGACRKYIGDINALIDECKAKNIYLIARIVAFKDPYLAEQKPDWCVHNKDGSIFQDKDGLSWLNPYNRQVWDYLLTIADEALNVGFDEIQFDYLRFSTDANMENAYFGEDVQGEDRREIITEFIEYASEQIHAVGGAVSADVYGVVIDSEKDQRIVGQDYVELSKYLDYISPMVYPSHYGPYNYNIPVPDAEPYRLVLAAMQSSRKVLAGIEEKKETSVSDNNLREAIEDEYTKKELAALEPLEGIKVQVRPWLQDFTATWVKGHISYGAEEIRAQIQAVYDAGYEEWILWNAANRYTEEGLIKEEQ